MFQTLSEPMKERMRFLEKADELDREDGTPQQERLRQIPPITGRFLALLAASAPPGDLLVGVGRLWKRASIT